MEQKLKKCDFCDTTDAICLCFQCMSYYCDSCYKLSHKSERKKVHKKEKIDYFAPIDIKCPEHELYPMDLFCVDEKGKIKFFNKYFFIF